MSQDPTLPHPGLDTLAGDYLKHFCSQEGLGAAALTTEEGFLIAGSGPVDLERLGALGAAGRPFEAGATHVKRFELDGIPLCLTSLGRPNNSMIPVASLCKILG